MKIYTIGCTKFRNIIRYNNVGKYNLSSRSTEIVIIEAIIIAEYTLII